MISRNDFFKFYAEKTDIFGAIPESVLDGDLRQELQSIPRVAVAVLDDWGAGDALPECVRKFQPDAVLPTIAYTGTEYGSVPALQRNVAQLRKLVEKELHVYMPPPVVLGAPRFWRALNVSQAGALQKRFAVTGACLGCTLYRMAIRVPLCRLLNADLLLLGSLCRSAGSSMEVSSREVLSGCARLLGNFGITLGHVRTSFDSPASDPAGDSADRPGCVLAPAAFGEPSGKGLRLQEYFELFAMPAVARIISKAMSGREVAYDHEVQATLAPATRDRPQRRSRRT